MASALSQRFREIRNQLREAKDNAAAGRIRVPITQLKEDLAAAKLQRKAATQILRAQLAESKKLKQLHATLSAVVKRKVEQGEVPPFRIPEAEQVIGVLGRRVSSRFVANEGKTWDLGAG